MNGEYRVGVNHCTCHPETCACADYVIICPDGTSFITSMDKQKLKRIAESLNKDSQVVSAKLKEFVVKRK